MRSPGLRQPPDLPTISSREYPNNLAAAGFQLVMTPSAVLVMIASPLRVITALISWAASEASLIARALRTIVETPTITPALSRIGETVREAINTDLSLRHRMVFRPSTA